MLRITEPLAGNDGRKQVERWVPRWMAFPPCAYTARGGVATVTAHAKVMAARDQAAQPDPDDMEVTFAEAACCDAGGLRSARLLNLKKSPPAPPPFRPRRAAIMAGRDVDRERRV